MNSCPSTLQQRPDLRRLHQLASLLAQRRDNLPGKASERRTEAAGRSASFYEDGVAMDLAERSLYAVDGPVPTSAGETKAIKDVDRLLKQIAQVEARATCGGSPGHKSELGSAAIEKDKEPIIETQETVSKTASGPGAPGKTSDDIFPYGSGNTERGA